MRHLFYLRACALLLALVVPAVVSAAAPTAYTGQAPVNSQSDDERVGALQTALANVVVAQTGDSGILARPDVAKAVAQAERYVLQYQYKPNSGDDGARLLLIVQFDSVAVDKLLARLGLGAQDDAAALSETPTDAVVWIGGIRDASDYARVVGYLARSNFVRATVPLQARGDSLLVKLSLATDLAHFLDAVVMERTLVVDTSAHADGVDATLVLGH
ncbi:MAG: DUF2066 domain-containing protein [Dokdonella sp.]|uniref:DUF2066 domain-containing protein n=1 Tax=Dokdonella sp. TaxID=2291710 RepID=UPI00326737A4